MIARAFRALLGPVGAVSRKIGDREHGVLDHVLVLQEMIERPRIGIRSVQIEQRSRTRLCDPRDAIDFLPMPPRQGLTGRKDDYIPCKGSGPWLMGSLKKIYKDCSQPDLKVVKG